MCLRAYIRAHTRSLMRNMLKWKIRVIRASPQQIGSELLWFPVNAATAANLCRRLKFPSPGSRSNSDTLSPARTHARMHACVRAGAPRSHALFHSASLFEYLWLFCCRWLQPRERRALSHYCSQALRAGCRPHRGILGF